jgi:hypothetical protein
MRTNRWGALVALAMTVVALQGCGSDGQDGGSDITGAVTGTVTGTVMLDDGAPPEGVEIDSLDTESAVFADAQGRFTVEDLRAGPRSLVLVHPGYEAQFLRVEVKPGKTTHISVTLKNVKLRVSGTIQLEGASSHEGITVALEGTAFSTTTDVQGNFVFEGVVADSYFLVASKDGYEAQRQALMVTEDTLVEPWILLTFAKPSLQGVVLLPDNDSPVGAVLALEGTAYLTTIGVASGYFRFTNIPPGTYTLAVSKEGYLPQTRLVTVGGEVSPYIFFALERDPG